MRLDYVYENDDMQSRLELGLDALMARETGGLRAVYDAWQSHGAGFERPRVEGISTLFVDVANDNPAFYRISNLREPSCGAYLEGKRIAEHPVEALRRDLMYEYWWVKDEARPSAYWLRHNFGGLRRSYHRLLLPLCDRAGRVTVVLCASRHLEAPRGSLGAIPHG